jgi:PIN domain nuclease of toxin-antitoxin system
MRSLLLDSNALVFYSDNSPRIGPKTRRLLASDIDLIYSPLSIFELNWKAKHNPKFRHGITTTRLQQLGFRESKVDSSVCESKLWVDSKDPFDNLLVGHAALIGAQFLTSDSKILGSGFDFVVDLTD